MTRHYPDLANYASGAFFGKCMKIVMSTNLEYRERERHRKRESRRQGSKAQREKERQNVRGRDKKQGRRIALEEQHENFILEVRNCTNAR